MHTLRKVQNIEAKHNTRSCSIGEDKTLEDLESFTNLRSILDSEGGTEAGVKVIITRIS